MVLTLGLALWAVSLLVALFLFVCVLLILTVLIQRPQGGGLSGAFGAGGSGAGQTAFGTKTGDALTIATITMFVLFLGLSIGLNFATRPENLSSSQGTLEPVDATTTVDPADPTSADPAAADPAPTDSAAETTPESPDQAPPQAPAEDAEDAAPTDAPTDAPADDTP